MHNIALGDARRAHALGEMAWALAVGGKVSFTEIGLAMQGQATPASKHKRVYRFCHNENVDPAEVQKALVRLLVGEVVCKSGLLGPHAVPLAIDWHNHDNGEMSGLRVSLITGGRALPLTWREVPHSELKGRQTTIEREAIEELVELRPPNITWVFLLDCGFHAPEVLDALNGAGYFIVRSQIHPLVHSRTNCWLPVGELPVEMGELVEFGWLTWSSTTPRTVRLVAVRMPPVKQRNRRAVPPRCKHKQRGYCPLITNLPESEAAAEDVLKMYCRRFEIEHSFRDITSATLGMDMEHIHLKSAEPYSRLLCIVAVAAVVRWLVGAEIERLGLKYAYTSSRPKDGHRVLSFVRLGGYVLRETRARIDAPIELLIQRHLRPAIAKALRVTGATWRQPERTSRLEHLASTPEDLPRPARSCRRRNKQDTKPFVPCQTKAPWKRLHEHVEPSMLGLAAEPSTR